MYVCMFIIQPLDMSETSQAAHCVDSAQKQSTRIKILKTKMKNEQSNSII